MIKNLTSNIKGDLYGGITAAVIALPLALAFGVSSGLGPVSGLYGAIALGFFAAFFGGTSTQVSGPTGPMTVIMAGIVAQYQHDVSLVFTIVIMAGFFQIILSMLKVGRYISYIPYSVVSGFMSGIGVIIISLQLDVFLGYDTAETVMASLLKLPELVTNPIWSAVYIGLVALFIVVFMPKSIHKYLPSPLVALVVGTVLSIYFWKDAPILGDIPQGLPDIHLPSFSLHELPNMMSAALTLALLGMIDSLLTSLVADNFTHTHHNSNKELMGQGVGNMVSGLIGGLPGAGATVRTVVNIKAGGKTPLSGMTHALILLVCLLGLGGAVEQIPKAALAAILLKVGWDIIDWSFLLRLWRAGISHIDKQACCVMLTVFSLTVFVDLIMAVAVGVLMKSMITMHRLSEHQMQHIGLIVTGKSKESPYVTIREKKLIDKIGDRLLFLHFTDPLSFGTARSLAHHLDDLESEHDVVLLDVTEATMIDVSIMMTLSNMIDDMVKQNKRIIVCGTDNAVHKMLSEHGVFRQLDEKHVFQTRFQALSFICKD